ncbi:hypothetical protein BJ322DRAFT_997340 [Thelephora terrestris]|uniref:DUF6593 domain-containing protein n=1 Tax=Thelephora terrestris TaxID=56493 RepID=A0A9P6LDD0_9AGAM|nr:hypothetical protein BJ322DRAFT_997340 [Thelephora terrestris]
MTEPPVYEVFFTGRDDARDGCIVIGEDTKPIFYRFETPPSYVGNTRTTVYRNAGEVVACMDWPPVGYQLGVLTIANRQSPMTRFVMHGSTVNSRVFLAADGRQFEWRRCPDDPNSYDATNHRIATYRRRHQDTPIGPSYAYMSYLFDNEHFLLESLIALCLNKWLDHPMQSAQGQ